MTEKEAISELSFHCIEFNGKPKDINNFLAAVNCGIEALKEIQKYREVGSVEACQEAVEKQKKIVGDGLRALFVEKILGEIKEVAIQEDVPVYEEDMEADLYIRMSVAEEIILKHMENAEEDKFLFMKLPCRLGDIIWDNDFGQPCGYEVTAFSLGVLDNDEYYADFDDEVVVHYRSSNGSITGQVPSGEFGKTVFLAKEEAEKALHRKRRYARKDDGNNT